MAWESWVGAAQGAEEGTKNFFDQSMKRKEREQMQKRNTQSDALQKFKFKMESKKAGLNPDMEKVWESKIFGD